MIDHVSFSQLTKMAECGEMWRRSYIEEEKGLPSVPMVFGSAVHAATERFEVSKLGRRMVSDPAAFHHGLEDARLELTKYAKDHVRELVRDLGITTEDLPTVASGQGMRTYYEKKLPKMIDSFLDRRYQDVTNGYQEPFDKAADAIEVELVVEIEGTKVIGAIDRLLVDKHEDLVIRDYKTGARKQTDPLQLEMYRWLLKTHHGLEAQYGQVSYIGVRPTTQIVKFNLTDEAVEEMVSRLIHQINVHSWPVTGPLNGACEMCFYRSTCKWGGVDFRGSS